jgi:hypothetical protein
MIIGLAFNLCNALVLLTFFFLLYRPAIDSMMPVGFQNVRAETTIFHCTMKINSGKRKEKKFRKLQHNKNVPRRRCTAAASPSAGDLVERTSTNFSARSWQNKPLASPSRVVPADKFSSKLSFSSDITNPQAPRRDGDLLLKLFLCR